MLIGELSRKTGTPRHTIRFYEKQGLITAGDGTNPYNNYKNYTDETLKRLLAIKRIKEFGFTLGEVAEFLDMMEDNRASCKNVSQKFNDKVLLIDQRIRELQDLKKSMVQEIKDCPCCVPEVTDETCPILYK